VRKGYDPRDFALVAFGGAGPLFACDIARELAIPRVIVPPAPGLTSALGLLTSDISYDHSTTLISSLEHADLGRIASAVAELEARALEQLRRDGIAEDRIELLRFADCRYVGQGYELRAAGGSGPVDRDFVAGLSKAFNDAHQREYGRHFPDKAVELVNLRVVGVGRIPRVDPPVLVRGSAIPDPQAKVGTRRVVFEVAGSPQALETTVWRRDALKAGNHVQGPAIVEQMDSTTVIPPDVSARVDEAGNLLIMMNGE
jgi:5-oxoprolinase (ATP-hydrolysing)/N-methylhydantoinase A